MTIPTTGLIGGPLRAVTARVTRTTSGARRIVAFTALLTALAVLLAVTTLPHDAPAVPPLAIPWLFLAGLFYVAEAKVIHLHIGRSAHSFSMSEIPVVIGLCCFSPVAFIMARLIGSGLALVVGRHQRSVKLAFNLALFGLCSVVSVAIVNAVGNPAHDLGPRLWAAIFAATVVENLISTLSVSIAISLTEGAPTYRRIADMVRTALTSAPGSIPLWEENSVRKMPALALFLLALILGFNSGSAQATNGRATFNFVNNARYAIFLKFLLPKSTLRLAGPIGPLRSFRQRIALLHARMRTVAKRSAMAAVIPRMEMEATGE